MFVLFGALLLAAIASPGAAEVTDKVSRLIQVTPGTPVVVQITVGEVVVTGWDRPQVSVDIVRRAPDAQQLATLSTQVEHTPEGVRVHAVQAGGEHDPKRRSDVVVRVPSTSPLRELSVFEGRIELADLREACSARIERGSIRGTRLDGPVRLETTIGNIRLERATVSRGPIRLRTFNGDVALELTRVPAHARILALSLGGTIASDIPLNRKEAWGPRFGETTLGQGEPVISIDVVNGNVAITVPAAGR